MATRATISVVIGDSIHQIYNHLDGYPEWLGAKLVEFYNTQETAEKLIGFGDMSSIGETTDDCIFYCRDRGDLPANTYARVFNKATFLQSRDGEDFDYLFKNGEWWLILDTDGNLRDLKSYLNEHQN